MTRAWRKYATVTDMMWPWARGVDHMHMECCLIDVIDRKGLSCEEVAHRMGVAVGYLKRIDDGDYLALRKRTVTTICEVLDCQVGDILKVVPD